MGDYASTSYDSHLLLEEYGLTSGADIKVEMTPSSATSNLVVTIKNVGPIPATGVVWTNALPAGLSLVAMNPLIDGTSIGTGTNVYNVGDLAVGTSRTYTLQVAPEEPGTYLCRAEAWPWEGDFNPDDNVATATLDFGAAEPRADLEVTVVPLYDEVLWNDGNRTNVINLVVVNNGPDAAENVAVTVSNLLPSVTFSAPAMTIPSLASLESRLYTIATTATPATAGIDTFFASVTAATADPDESNNQDSADVSYPAYTDVSVELDFEEPVYGLRGGRFRVVTSNAGPVAIQNGSTFANYESDQFQFRNELPVGCSITNWVEFGPVLSLGTDYVTASSSVILNADTGVEDIDPDNNDASNEAEVIWPDLSVAIVDSPDPVDSGASVTYTVSVICTNDVVTNISVRVTLPSNRDASGDIAPAGFTADGTDAYVLSGLSLDAGASTNWEFTVKAPETDADTTMTAKVKTDPVPEWDATPDNNEAEAETAVNRALQADLSVTVAPAATVVEWNDGNRTNVIHVVIKNNGPDEVAVSSFSASNTLAGVIFQLPLLDNPSLAFGASLEFDIRTSAFPEIVGTDLFTAWVSGSLPDPDTDNNAASCEVFYPPYGDLAVEIAFEEPVYGLGENRVIVLSGNNGPQEVTNAVTVVSCQGQSYVVTNSLAAGVVVTNRIAIGQVATLGAATIDATAVISVPRAVDSPAQIGSQVIDFNPGNNEADASASVLWPDIAVAISDSPDPVAAGGTVAYAVSATCTNAAASNITVRVTLPSNRVADEDVVPAGFTADGADDYILSGLALDAGASANWSFSVKAPSPDADETMTAKVATDPVPDWDATPADNEATAETTVSQRIHADVGIAITNALDVVEWNDGNRTNVLSVYVYNNGPSPAEDVAVVISNTLSGVTFTAPAMPAGALAKGQTIVLAVPTRALPETIGTDLYTAVVTSATEDGDDSNNTATSEVQYPGYADVGVALSFVEPVYGFRTNYLEAVSSNNGPLDMTNVVTEVTCQGTTHSVTNDLVAGAVVTNRIEIGEIASVGAATVSAVASIGYVDGLAGATADPVADYDHDNDNATAEADVIWPDVAVTLTASPNPVAAGGIVTFTATATAKDGRADDLSFTMTLPDGSTETFSGVSLPDGGSTNWTFTATAPVADADSTMTGVFALSPVPQWDADASNNEATASVTASARQYADVAAYASFGSGTLSGRENGEYTFYAAVSNVSDVAAENVSVQLVLDTSDATWTAPDGWTLSGDTLELDGGIASLEPGAGTNFEATVAISGRVTQLQAKTIVSAAGDPVAANDTATATQAVGWPDLRVVMHPSKTSVVEGEVFTCDIFIMNNGAGTASNATLTTTWSGPVSKIASTGASISGLKAVFSDLNLPGGSSISKTVSVTVGAVPDNQTQDITGEAEASVPFGDQTPDDNKASCTITASPYAAKGTIKWFLSKNHSIWFAQITIKNTGMQPVKSLWFALADRRITKNGTTQTLRIISPAHYTPVRIAQGTALASAPAVLPDGRRYVDLTAAMNAAATSQGDKNGVWDPRETITIGVSAATEALYTQNGGKYSVTKEAERVLGLQIPFRDKSGTVEAEVDNFSTVGYRCGVMYHPCDLDKNFHISESEYTSALGHLKTGAYLPRDEASFDPGGAYPQFDSPEAEFLFVSEGYLGEKSGQAGGYIWSMKDQQWRIYYK